MNINTARAHAGATGLTFDTFRLTPPDGPPDEFPLARSTRPVGGTIHTGTPHLDDWMALFDAVKARLLVSGVARQPQVDGCHWIGSTDGVVSPCVPPPAAAAEVKDCVQALSQLQQMLLQSDVGRDQAEALLHVQSALFRTRQDLAQAQAAHAQASHRALHDGLTTLPNRDCFRQRLDQALAQPSPPAPAPALAVLYLDLDGLKLINDSHGHAAGDELLRIVAARLLRSIRAQDMVCRLGGDEFACLLGNAFSRDQLSHLACKLFDAVSAPLKIGPLELTVRPSIGIAICPTDGNSSDALLHHADSAMYRAKRNQLGYAFFDASSDR